MNACRDFIGPATPDSTSTGMTLHNPPYPGEFIREVYLEPFGITGGKLSFKLGVSPSTLNRILNGDSSVNVTVHLPLCKRGIERDLSNKISPNPSFSKRGTERLRVSTEMALRLSKALGRSPESWLAMQDNYALWHARKTVNLDAVEKIEFKVT